MNTASFNNARKLDKVRLVSIAQSSPRWYDGEEYRALAPSWKLINLAKQGDNRYKKYTELYHKQVLFKLNPYEVYTQLKDAVLLCWEPADEFCHRHLVANWLMHEIDNIEILEVK